MNCRKFEENIADYVAGRLNSAENTIMAAHSETCPLCARLEQNERRLSARFAVAPEVPATPDFWPMLAMQLPARRPRFAFPRLWITAPAFTAAAAAIAFVWLQSQSITSPPRDVKPGKIVLNAGDDKYPMTNFVYEVRNIGVAETDMLWEETRATHQMGIASASEGGVQ